jgi:hypothetical protein
MRRHSFRHEGKGSDSEAHALAHLAASLSAGRHVWFSNPSEALFTSRVFEGIRVDYPVSRNISIGCLLGQVCRG